MKHSNSRFKADGATHKIPFALAEALENIMMERIHIGEEVTMDFCSQVLIELVKVWNSKIDELKPQVQQYVGQKLLRDQDQQLPGDSSRSQLETAQKHAVQGLQAVLDSLRPIEVSENFKSLQTLWSSG